MTGLTGKTRRLQRLFDPTSGRTVLTPLDDSLLSGPEGGLRDMAARLDDVIAGEPNGIVGFKGLFIRNSTRLLGVGGIMNLTASTTRRTHTRKTLVSSVDEAVALGLDAVAIHVNLSSEYETEMLATLGAASRDCERLGMPLMTLMYVRAERDGRDYNYEDVAAEEPSRYAEMVRHAVRVGFELGADLIKAQFTGSADTFSTVVEAACGVPVVIAGGPLVEPATMMRNAEQAVSAGAAGVCFGRNVFNRSTSAPYIRALRAIVHERRSAAEALSTVSVGARA